MIKTEEEINGMRIAGQLAAKVLEMITPFVLPGVSTEELDEKFNPIQLVANNLNNAAWLITNGASDIGEIEKAVRLGLGLKKPLFETAKEIGIKNIVDELTKLADKHGEFYRPDPLLISMQ